jgi:type VI secretion system protein ImpC
VDRDNFDKVLAKIRPAVRLPVGADAGEEVLTFSELEDFHPDRILRRSAMFRRLLDLRERAQDPRSAAAVLGELGIASTTPSPEPAEVEPGRREPSAEAMAARVASGSLLEEAITQTESTGGEAPARTKDELQQFVQRVAAAHTAAAVDPRQRQILTVIDRALALQLRALLHFPPLQSLEAAWRAVFLLVRRIPTSAQLNLHLLDVSKQDLASDLLASSNLQQSRFYRAMVERTSGTPGAEPWSLLVGNFVFGPSSEEAELLARLAKTASHAGAIFLAAASPALLGCPSSTALSDEHQWQDAFPDPAAASAWQRLRSLPEASHVGLALPRFLLRLPYGQATDPIETFDFEEMPGVPAHEDYLWGNPAFVCALLLAEAFSEEGWQMRPGRHLELDRLPLHIVAVDGQTVAQPCAETLLTECVATSILEKGLMPLASLKDQDSVRLVRFQSIADPLRPLTGPWTG